MVDNFSTNFKMALKVSVSAGRYQLVQDKSSVYNKQLLRTHNIISCTAAHSIYIMLYVCYIFVLQTGRLKQRLMRNDKTEIAKH